MSPHFWKFLLLTFVVGCTGSTDPMICTREFRYGISMEIVDAIDQAPRADGSTMTLRDGSYVESTTQSNGLTMLGAGERPGTYIVTVAHPRYHTWVRTDVVVTSDECHVHTVSLRAKLETIKG